ncbi:MAG: hypothetical protein FJ276_31160 [Planctomycetes bacterium]|nr:hypothetical protein [Planctomycetota bacterium]
MDLMWNELDTRLLSPKLWKGFAPPINGVFPNTANGNKVVGLFDDFTGFGRCCPASSGLAYYTSNGISYRAFEDDDGSITAAVPTTTPAVDANGIGVIKLTGGNTDNDDTVLQAGGGSMMPFNVIYATAKELVFECRVKYSSIADGDTDFFFGLFGAAGAVNNGWLADDSAAFADNDLLGFTRTLSTGTSALKFVYDRVGGTTGTHATTVHTMVADTYFKVGFRWKQQTRKTEIYTNGEYVTAVAASVAAATPWPTLYMNFLAGVKYQATTQDSMYIDWWACAQML